MMKTALSTAVLSATLFLVLGSSWADEPGNTGGARISDEIARHLAERLSGREPGSARIDSLVVSPGENMPVSRNRTFRVVLPSSPLTPCLAQAGSAESDPCAAARELSRLGPCLDPQNCPALDTWRQLYGGTEPRVVPAEPAPPSEPVLTSEKDEERP